MKVNPRTLPDPLERFTRLPPQIRSVPISTFAAACSPEEKLLQGIIAGRTPAQMRNELGKHVERLVDRLLENGLVVFDGQKNPLDGHWRNSYKPTQKGLEYMVKTWLSDSLF